MGGEERDKGDGLFEFDVTVDEAERVHPGYGAAELGPGPVDGGLCEGGPGGVSVDK